MSEIEPINVGLADGDLRLAIAVEALRQSELRLASQQNNLVAAEGRATSLLGWSIAGLSALAFVALDQKRRNLALPPAGFLFLCAISCIVALWPKTWNGPGYTPAEIAAWGVQSELEMRESIASGFETASVLNKRILGRIAFCMIVAWIALVLAPIAGVILVLRAGIST